MSSSAQLEREAEQTRGELSHTLEELRERITPGQIVDQFADFAKDSGGGEFVRNLGGQMADNPLPVCLIGAGVAWLMMSNRRGSTGTRTRQLAARNVGEDIGNAMQTARARSGESASGARDAVNRAAGSAERGMQAAGETATELKHHISETASSLSESASSGYEMTKQRAAAAGDAIGSAVSAGYDSMTDTASHAGSRVAQSASSLAQQTADATKGFLRFCTEQPLVLAGLGLAIGAAIGASFPQSEAENRLMGERSDELKERTQEFAREQYAKGKEAVQAAAQAVQESVDAPTDVSTDKPSAHTEASLVPAEAGKESGGHHDTGAAEKRHGFVE